MRIWTADGPTWFQSVAGRSMGDPHYRFGTVPWGTESFCQTGARAIARRRSTTVSRIYDNQIRGCRIWSHVQRLRRRDGRWRWAVLVLTTAGLAWGWFQVPHSVHGLMLAPDGSFEFTIPAGWSAQVVRSPEEGFGVCPCYDIELRSDDATDPDLRISIEWVTWSISCGGPPGAEPIPSGWVMLGGQRIAEHEWSVPDGRGGVALGGCTGFDHRLKHPGPQGTEGQFGVAYWGHAAFATHRADFEALLATWRWTA